MKSKIVYICSNCGSSFLKWAGKCSSCGSWDSLIEEVETVQKKNDNLLLTKKTENRIISLSEIDADHEFRIQIGLNELDRVLGGGIVPGSLILIGGDPGIGKSTLMLQMCNHLKNFKPLYVTGEESLKQIKLRAARLEDINDNLLLLAETNIENVDFSIRNSDSRIIIIDSIQSMYSDRIESTPGSVVQVRECTSLLMQTAKTTGKAIFIIGHVTKDGFIAGPKILEHMVDTVLQFEGEKTYSYRILRALKNRFGSTNEIGLFEMADKGLKEVTNPSEIFLAHRSQNDSGIAIVASMEGSRPILLEVQALVTPSGYGVPQRTSNGFDLRRLQLLLAVLEKRLGLQFRQYDVFVNVAGGVYLNDPAVDLGIAAALVSSLRDLVINTKTIFIGEIGLTGEVRQVSQLDKRVGEAQKLGFESVTLPSANIKKLSNTYKIKLDPVERISIAFANIFS